jgi:RimJ/RimL family protein N-acetyltransferase
MGLARASGQHRALGAARLRLLLGRHPRGRVHRPRRRDLSPELAWHLFDGHEGQGYAQEAALAARADYHARFKAPAPISYVDVANTRSEALALRLGARREATVADPEGDYHIYRHPAPMGAA